MHRLGQELRALSDRCGLRNERRLYGLELHRRFFRLGPETVQRIVHVLDELRQIVDRHAVVADMSRNDIGGEGNQGFREFTALSH